MTKRVPNDGEKVTCWGQTITWTSEHPTDEDLKPLLYKYDKIGGDAYDRALQIFNDEQDMKKKEGQMPKGAPAKPDIFQIVKDHAATDPVLGKLWEQVNYVPDWVDWDQLARGQQIFWRYAMANLIGLGYQSLFVGMAAARTIEVLVRTGGFAPAAAQRRGIETAQWNLEIMRGIESLKPGGDGWVSTVRVRLLHSAVRSKIMQMYREKPEYYNEQEYGIPINDFDSAGTICTFSAAPIWFSLPQQKIQLRPQEIKDYVALWRYIAYLIGAPEEYFDSPDKCRKLQESGLYYEIDPNQNSKVLANNLLDAFSKGPPKLPSGLVRAGARALAGDELCDELEVGKSNFIWRGIWYSNMVMYKGFAYMCRSVPWLDKRNISMMKKLSWKIVVESKYGLKGEKTKFPLKYKPSYKVTKAE
ncbi:uncharacterized protein PV09_05110 [Verruconis gallopava]|uniref:ER-bound oxygenase mpaB/mpaB'/Rubber oxygenase catalytic domain-containing protein n=1 Tax=Verruconis gallopava TaxID=253628 RepID=A0A0D2AB28_9PEZI|nr:uncharacterized protein PV09_05110 [Verruconis gallopava]KIW03810.1 hypothetical protein PV09_05110 [Verruconis gallopava]